MVGRGRRTRACDLRSNPAKKPYPQRTSAQYVAWGRAGQGDSRIRYEIVHRVPDQDLQLIQQYLENHDSFEAAVTIFWVRLALYPKTSAEKTQFSHRLEAAGKQDLVQLLTCTPEASTRPSTLKVDVETAKRSDFFKFFNFEQVASENKKEGGTMVIFRPRSSSAFRNLVELNGTLRGGVVTTWRLYLNRSSLTNEELRPFAADLAKSFLAFAVPKAGSDLVGQLIEEIWTWPHSERKFVPVPGAGRPTKLPAIPSAGYLVYLGLQEQCEQRLMGGRLILRNVTEVGSSGLVIEVETTP